MSDSPIVTTVIDAVRQQSGTNAEVTKAPETSANTSAKVESTPDPKLDMYARKERQLQKQRREFEAERQAFQAKKAGYDTDYVPKSKLASDPIAALAEAGVSYDQLTEMLLNQPNQNDPGIKQMLARIRSMEEKQTASEKAQQAATEAQFEQAKKQIGTEVQLLIDSDNEFETVKAQDMHEAVTELIIETFNTEGYLMDVREAALEVENALIEEGIRLAGLSKVQSRLKPAAEVTAAPAPQQSQLKTLTNSVSAQAAPKRLTEKERIARAIAIAEGRTP